MPAPNLPGTVRIYAAGLGFLGLGEIEAAGPLGAAATYCRDRVGESCLRAGAATRTMRAFLKGLSY